MMELRIPIDFFDNRFLMFVLDQMANEFERDHPGEKAIRMTLGKSELPLHPNILKSMQEALFDFKKSALVYPGGLPELKERLSLHYQQRYQIDIPSKNFIISVGTSTIFRNLFSLLVKAGDEVLLPLPYYSLYKFSALLAGAKIKYYKINPDALTLDCDSFKNNFTDKTKIVVINSPGNPLGNILSEKELRYIDSVVDGKAVIINDEIYTNVCFDEPCPSVINMDHLKSTFITTNAFSKGYRMYSRRVGYCIVPDALIEPLTVVQHHTLLTTDPVVQYGAIAALDHPNEVTDLVALYQSRRDYTVEKFKTVELVNAISSKGSFYLTLNCQPYLEKHGYTSSLELAKNIFEKTHVATVPGSDFGLPHTLRLSFSTSQYNEGIDRLVGFFEDSK